MLQSLFSFVLALGVLVFFHELGHYSVAKWFGVKVIRFSIGFGKPIFTWVNRKNGEEWTVGWLPLGGYVRMLDERDPESVQGHDPNQMDEAFNRKPVLQRMAIVLAGPVANLLLAVVLYAILAANQTQTLSNVVATPSANSAAALIGLEKGDRVIAVNQEEVSEWSELSWQLIRARLFGDALQIQVNRGGVPMVLKTLQPQVLADQALDSSLPSILGFYPLETRIQAQRVLPNSPAQQAGIQAGDVLLQINGVPLDSSSYFRGVVKNNPNRVLSVTIDREGHLHTLSVTPVIEKSKNGQSIGKVGLALGGKLDILTQENGFFDSIALGARRTTEISLFSLMAFGKMLTGSLSLDHLSGPVSIASAAGESSSLGIFPFLGFLAMVSVSLGILNLLPIPVLDGGHLMYYLAELLMRKPVSEVWIARGQKIGLALIGALTCIAFFNDLQRLF